MLKGMLAGIIGTRHERERKRIQPIVDAINAEYERLHSVSEEELRGQTEKFRGIIREATSELEAKIVELKAAKHAAPDAAEQTFPPVVHCPSRKLQSADAQAYGVFTTAPSGPSPSCEC